MTGPVTATRLAKLEDRVGELVAAHDRADARDFTRWRDDPVGFCRNVLRWEPWSMQEQIARLVMTDAQVTIRSCNSAGKDALMMALAAWFIYACGGRVILMAPTLRQAVEVCMLTEFRAHWERGQLPGRLYQDRLRLPGSDKAALIAQVSGETTSLTGFHAERVMVILSEAPGIAAAGFEAALRCAVGPNDRLVAYGQPERPDGDFWATHQPGSGWTQVRIRAQDLPTFTGERDIPGLLTPEGVERIRRMFGQGSAVWRYSVEAEFPADAEDALIRRDWLTAAADLFERETRDLTLPVLFAPAAFGALVTYGLDVGAGRDPSCLCTARGPLVAGFDLWNERDTMETARTVRTHLARLAEQPYGPMAPGWYPEPGGVTIDVIGPGLGVYDRLNELGAPASEFRGNAKATDDHFANQRTEAFWHVRTELERSRLLLARDEELWAELAAHRYATVGGRIALVGKDAVKAVLRGRSPNRADALTMALSGAAFSGLPVSAAVGVGF